MNFSFFAKSAERQTAKKPRYHTGQNCLFMLRLGKKECPSIFFTAAALIVLNTGLRLLELFTAPALLNAVQTSETITQMLGTVLLFSSGTIAVSALCSSLISPNIRLLTRRLFSPHASTWSVSPFSRKISTPFVSSKNPIHETPPFFFSRFRAVFISLSPKSGHSSPKPGIAVPFML